MTQQQQIGAIRELERGQKEILAKIKEEKLTTQEQFLALSSKIDHLEKSFIVGLDENFKSFKTAIAQHINESQQAKINDLVAAAMERKAFSKGILSTVISTVLAALILYYGLPQ